MDLGIAGKKALVVGASEGIGFVTAKGLAEEGAEVFICSRNPGKLNEARERLMKETGQGVEWFAADVMRAPDVAKLASWIGQKAASLDILVSAVGGSRRARFEELRDEDWLENYEFNVLGAVRVVRALLPALRKARNPAVVLLGAAGAKQPYANQVGVRRPQGGHPCAHQVAGDRVLLGRPAGQFRLSRADADLALARPGGGARQGARRGGGCDHRRIRRGDSPQAFRETGGNRGDGRFPVLREGELHHRAVDQRRRRYRPRAFVNSKSGGQGSAAGGATPT